MQPLNEKFAAALLAALANARPDAADLEPMQDARPTPEQKALLERLVKVVDARAAELQVSAEVLAPRGELKALAMANGGSLRDSRAFRGWRKEQIGTRLAQALG